MSLAMQESAPPMSARFIRNIAQNAAARLTQARKTLCAVRKAGAHHAERGKHGFPQQRVQRLSAGQLQNAP